MTPYTHHQQQPAWPAESRTDWEAPTQPERKGRTGLPMSHQAEQAARAVMHPDPHDLDWRYYFGAMAG